MELTILAAYVAGAAVLTVPLAKVKRRLELSRAKHRSLTGHARLARQVASLIPFYEYDEHRFFRSDNPPEKIAIQRWDGFRHLSSVYRERFARTSALTAQVQSGASDLQFISAYRIPFQYSRFVRQ